MKKILLAAIMLTCGLMVNAQQEAAYSMYRFNGLYINPAYAGSREVISAMGIYRHQWVNVPGAPRSASGSIHSPLRNNNIALGLMYSFDKIGVNQTNDINAIFAYRIPLGKKKKVKLSFGISAGVTNYRSDLDGVATTQANDPSFAGNSQNLWIPNVGAGVYAYSDKFFVGLAVPRILASRLQGPLSIWESNDNVAKRYFHLVGSAGYVFSLGQKVRFMPSVMMKYVPKYAPIDFDFNATFIFIDRIWLGAGYRLNDSYNFMAAFNITKQFRVGYCYDLTVSPLSKHTTGTHEVMAGFDFDFNKKRIVNPRYVKYF